MQYLLRSSLLQGFFILILTSSFFNLQAQATLNQASPEAVGISTERLKKIDDLLQNAVDDDYLPGAVVMIGRKGQIPYLEAFGYRDVAGKDPMEVDDIFRMASMTKPIVSVGIMMLYEEGYFLLDDPISKFAPEFAEMQVFGEWDEKKENYTTTPANKPITFRQLLSHTSGIGYPFINEDLRLIAQKKGLIQGYSVLDVSLKENMKILSEMPLVHQPGERWTYGLSTDLLGYLIEQISGQALDKFLQERIFKPLGMEDTGFYLEETKADRLAGLYFHNETGEYQRNPDPNANYPFTGAKRYFSGGAGLASTAEDYSKFLQMLLNKGSYNGQLILGRKTVELMTSDHLHGTKGGPTGFGLGFAIATEREAAKDLSSPGNYRWGGIFGTDFWVDPQEELFGIILTQVLPFQDKDHFFARIQNTIYQTIID
jgi:CubicO group peptidase (beta-lactamase class C family)